MLVFLPPAFLLVACVYAMAGFGGGSTYIALLAVSGLPIVGIPILALSCNLIVTAQGSWALVRKGDANWSILGPLLSGSIPAAFLGGAWRLPEPVFLLALAGGLTLAGFAMLTRTKLENEPTTDSKEPNGGLLFCTGAIIGMLAGVTGIGGGIYLAPVMHLLSWARARTVATCTSIFIAFNSAAGLLGQFTKGHHAISEVPISLLIACPLAVLVGGRLGSFMLTDRLPSRRIKLITAVIILLVAARLWATLAF